MTDSRPHICFVAPNAFPMLANSRDVRFVGGAELQQVLVARELAHRGYPVSMVCLNFGQQDRCPIDGITVHRAYRPHEGVPVIRFLWPRLTSLWSCLKRADADIFYQRGASMLTGVMAAWCRRHERKSVFAVAGATKIRFARDRWLFDYGLRNVDRIVVQNVDQAGMIRSVVGRESILIPNGYQPVVVQAQATEHNVLWVSTIRRVKQPDIFLDLAQALPELRFTMVGGPDLMDKPLFDRITARAGKLPNVHFAGFVPYSEVHHYFDDATLFVNTSESEGFPNTFLQAWARGIPAVSFIESGARLDEQPVGLVVRSTDEMASTINTLLTDSAALSRLGTAGKRYVEKNHGMDRVVGLYEQLFRSMVAE